MVPSTVLQEDGASNSEQFSHACSPFGVSWYFTAFCCTFAYAGVVVPMMAAPVAAPAIADRNGQYATARNPV